MTSSIFETLTGAVSGTPLVAVLASTAWGVLSVVLSPCHLASIPLIVGFIGEQGTLTTRRAFILALLFGCGILATIGLIGIVTASLGSFSSRSSKRLRISRCSFLSPVANSADLAVNSRRQDLHSGNIFMFALHIKHLIILPYKNRCLPASRE